MHLKDSFSVSIYHIASPVVVLTKYSDWWVAGRAWPPGGELGLTSAIAPPGAKLSCLWLPPRAISRLLQLYRFCSSISVSRSSCFFILFWKIISGEKCRGFTFLLVADSNSFQENKSRLNFSQD